MREARAALRIPIFAMTRPRGGDFVYTAEEFSAMQQQIESAKHSKMDGVVLGLLTPVKQIDSARARQLVAQAHPLQVTFHRAFDEAGATPAALEQIISTGATRVLTSGGAPAAPQAAPYIRSLIEAARNRIIVMPGAGIHAGNFAEVLAATGATEFHTGLGAIQPYNSTGFSRFSAEIRAITSHKPAHS